ncbi:MAG: hypothetical protein JJ979_05765 [Roseibium sp.]|nr:hypothetical protein [Roseibium sp.]
MDHPVYKHGEVLSVDPISGTRKVYYDIDEKHGAIVTERYLDDEILARNAEERAANAGSRFGDMQKIAAIPEALAYENLMPAIRQYDEEYIRRWLNDPDNAAFRTFEGTI